jgi:hypothetical protein
MLKNLEKQRVRSFDFSDFILRAELEESGERIMIIPDYEPTEQKVKKKKKKNCCRSKKDISNNSNTLE